MELKRANAPNFVASTNDKPEPVEMNLSIPERLRAFKRSLTAEEVCVLFAMHKNTIYAMAKRGEIPNTRIGITVRFGPSLLAEWWESQTIKTM